MIEPFIFTFDAILPAKLPMDPGSHLVMPDKILLFCQFITVADDVMN